MTVWSLATSRDGAIDVSLYLTKWQAYEGLLADMFPDEDWSRYPVTDAEAMHTRLHNLTHTPETEENAQDIAESFFEAGIELEIDWEITKHDHPWTFPADTEEAAARASVRDQQEYESKVRAAVLPDLEWITKGITHD